MLLRRVRVHLFFEFLSRRAPAARRRFPRASPAVRSADRNGAILLRNHGRRARADCRRHAALLREAVRRRAPQNARHAESARLFGKAARRRVYRIRTEHPFRMRARIRVGIRRHAVYLFPAHARRLNRRNLLSPLAALRAGIRTALGVLRYSVCRGERHAQTPRLGNHARQAKDIRKAQTGPHPEGSPLSDSSGIEDNFRK